MPDELPGGIPEIFGPELLRRARELMEAENAALAQEHVQEFIAQFSEIGQSLEALIGVIHTELPRLQRIERRANSALNPYRGTILANLADIDDIHSIHFADGILGAIHNRLQYSVNNLGMIQELYDHVVRRVLTAQNPTLHDVKMAAQTMPRIIESCVEEFAQTSLGFEEFLIKTYELLSKDFKKLRKKYSVDDGQDEEEFTRDELFKRIFGEHPKRQKTFGPDLALFEDNCILTETLTDIVRVLPVPFRYVVPEGSNGRARKKTLRHIDEGAIENAANLLIRLSHTAYMTYLDNPNTFLSQFSSIITDLYEHYKTIDERLKEVIRITSSHSVIRTIRAHGPELERPLADPKPVVKKLQRMNYMAIVPSPEITTPKTRLEKDYAATRMKLFDHIYGTLHELARMDAQDPQTEARATAAVRKAIDLKEALDDIVKTGRDRALQRDIAGDNEFYICQTGGIGRLELERAPAPKIKYEDVRGASFDRAKQHVLEVIHVASHAHVMQLSAPRGDVKSNILLIGPYGCGKTEFARAVGADDRVIGVNVSSSDLLTAYMHESVKNVKRLWEAAAELRKQSRATKPVALIMDEFDRLFRYGEGVHAAYDGPRMEGEIQAMMDGVVGYEGVFMIAMTNIPKQIPEAILRRFKFVDIVGQLALQERADLLQMFLERGMPLSPDVTPDQYIQWAERLEYAPGDVLGKIADEVHFKFMSEITQGDHNRLRRLESTLRRRSRNEELSDKDRTYVKRILGQHRYITPEEVTGALESVLGQPQIQMQIKKAKQTYKDAADIMNGLASVDSGRLGFTAHGSRVWT